MRCHERRGDSSIAASLLKEEATRSSALRCVSGLPADDPEKPGSCLVPAQIAEARRVAGRLEFPPRDFTGGTFEKEIIGYFVDEYLRGARPTLRDLQSADQV